MAVSITKTCKHFQCTKQALLITSIILDMIKITAIINKLQFTVKYNSENWVKNFGKVRKITSFKSNRFSEPPWGIVLSWNLEFFSLINNFKFYSWKIIENFVSWQIALNFGFWIRLNLFCFDNLLDICESKTIDVYVTQKNGKLKKCAKLRTTGIQNCPKVNSFDLKVESNLTLFLIIFRSKLYHSWQYDWVLKQFNDKLNILLIFSNSKWINWIRCTSHLWCIDVVSSILASTFAQEFSTGTRMTKQSGHWKPEHLLHK